MIERGPHSTTEACVDAREEMMPESAGQARQGMRTGEARGRDLPHLSLTSRINLTNFGEQGLAASLVGGYGAMGEARGRGETGDPPSPHTPATPKRRKRPSPAPRDQIDSGDLAISGPNPRISYPEPWKWPSLMLDLIQSPAIYIHPIFFGPQNMSN